MMIIMKNFVGCPIPFSSITSLHDMFFTLRLKQQPYLGHVQFLWQREQGKGLNWVLSFKGSSQDWHRTSTPNHNPSRSQAHMWFQGSSEVQLLCVARGARPGRISWTTLINSVTAALISHKHSIYYFCSQNNPQVHGHSI